MIVAVNKGIAVLDVNELTKDLESCCKKTKCDLGSNIDSYEIYYYIESETIKQAEETISLFKKLYTDKYGDFINRMFKPLNKKEFKDSGVYISEDIMELYDIVLQGEDILHAWGGFYGHVDDLLGRLTQVFEGVKSNLGERGDGLSMSIKQYEDYINIFIPCSDVDLGSDIADEWFNYCQDLKLKGSFFDWDEIEWMFQGNLVSVEGETYLKGWVLLQN